jgi:hypothetical protein
MSRKFLFTLTLISMLAAMLTVAAAPAPARRITLVETVYLREKGVTFKFSLEGEFKDRELKGSIQYDGKAGNIHCNYNDKAALVVCTAPKATAQHAGATGIVTLAGFSFAVIIPAYTSSR